MKIRAVIIIIVALAFQGLVQARETHPFNDGWLFLRGPFGAVSAVPGPEAQWEQVTLPHTWNAQDMQQQANDFYQGVGYYRKMVSFGDEICGRRVFLRFEGVGACCEVYVNGRLVGSHRGAYSAFACEIGTALKTDDENEIVVKADNRARPDVIPVNHSLFGVYGGIYRPVQLIITEMSNIAVTDCASSGVYITQRNVSAEAAEIGVKVKMDNASLKPELLEVESVIRDREGNDAASERRSLLLTPQGTQSMSIDFRLCKPHLWHGRRDPYLYSVAVRLLRDGEVIDEVVQPLGIRRFEVVAGDGFYLNGEKYPMYGVARHQDWWGLGSAVTAREHAFDMEQIMEIGATTVRFAHYQQAEEVYSLCDSLGLIAWAEIPFVNRVTGYEAENAASQLRELIRQNFNHPSIYVWCLHNEVYTPAEYTSSLTSSLHDIAKSEDPDRYTVSVNGYGYASHTVNQNADIQGMNRYFGWYEKKLQDIEPWIEGLERDYPWQRFVLSEYGADANIAHQTEYLGDALNWSEPFYPETFQTKTHEYQWSVIAEHPYIIASYVWNMFDFAVPSWSRGGVPARNMKGLVTFDRKVRKDSFYWYKANWSSEPVLYITQRRNTEREKRHTSVTVYSNMGCPRVWLNGRELKGVRRGGTDVHYIIDYVSLRRGRNVIRASVMHDGTEYTDRIEWNYSGERRRTVDTSSAANEHSGW